MPQICFRSMTPGAFDATSPKKVFMTLTLSGPQPSDPSAWRQMHGVKGLGIKRVQEIGRDACRNQLTKLGVHLPGKAMPLCVLKLQLEKARNLLHEQSPLDTFFVVEVNEAPRINEWMALAAIDLLDGGHEPVDCCGEPGAHEGSIVELKALRLQLACRSFHRSSFSSFFGFRDWMDGLPLLCTQDGQCFRGRRGEPEHQLRLGGSPISQSQLAVDTVDWIAQPRMWVLG